MIKFLILFLFIFNLNLAHSQNLSPAPDFAQTVFDDIFDAMGDGKVIKPKLLVSDQANEVATYSPGGAEPLIKLGLNFIELIRNFGQDSSNALAHVLGHELAHVVLRQNDLISKIGSGYASHEFNKKVKKLKKTLQDTLFERQADEFATLYAHIAGYKTTNIGESLLDSIYARFKLTDDMLSRYPTLDERKEIVRASQKKMETLKRFFDTAIICLITENHELSEALNRAIIREDFPSREIHNNLGISFLFQGLNKLDTIKYPYKFPLAIDLTTRLVSTNERSIGWDSRSLLEKADEHFSNATKISETYYIAWLNRAIVNFILGNEKQYEISLLNLSDCKEPEVLHKLEVLLAIKDNYYQETKSTIPYNVFCERGNKYACSQTNLVKTHGIMQEFPVALGFMKGFQNPKFDFNEEKAKIYSDSLMMYLSVTRNDFRCRQVTKNNIIGERWFHVKGNSKPLEIYKIKDADLTSEDLEFVKNNFQSVAYFCGNNYYRFENFLVIIKSNKATFLFIN
jgi:hypothetical protein